MRQAFAVLGLLVLGSGTAAAQAPGASRELSEPREELRALRAYPALVRALALEESTGLAPLGWPSREIRDQLAGIRSVLDEREREEHFRARFLGER